MKFFYFVLFTGVLGFAGCVTLDRVYARRDLSVISGRAGAEKLSGKSIESTLAGVTDILTSHGWKSYPTSLSYEITGGRIYHINYFLEAGSFGCSAEMDRKTVSFRFYEWETSPRSGVFLATDSGRAEVQSVAREVEAYLKTALPADYELNSEF